MKNSDKFLDYFNKIDAHLNKKGGYSVYTPFSEK